MLSILFRKKETRPNSTLVLHNTLGNKDEAFEPPKNRPVRMYNCGPTVYDTQHIGNLAAFVFADVLRKTLEYSGMKVDQIINITDFGHLTSDADEGEDKMTKALKREKLPLTLENMRTIAEKYTKVFLEDLERLNMPTSQIRFPRASEYVPAQIAMIQTLEEKGYAYKTPSGVFFDTARFPHYGELGNVDTEHEKAGARVDVNPDKHSPADFVLWKPSKKLGWDSPWGKGFPGWHIECSAMARVLLGDQIDIHTGGPEHIAIHHNNEIAQSEAASGRRPFSRFWLHRAWIQLNGKKIAKSDGNVVYLSEIIEKGLHPLAYRYFLLGGSYRTPMNFTWEALEAANTAFLRLRKFVDSYPEGGTPPAEYQSRINERINDNLDTAGALGEIWKMTKDQSLSEKDIRAEILDADKVLGLGFSAPDKLAEALYTKTFGAEVKKEEAPEHVRELLEKRESARTEKNWPEADRLRNEIEAAGYTVQDDAGGARLIQK